MQYFSFFPLGLGTKALWTGFCSYSVSLCQSPFRRPVCSSNFGIRKSDLNQTNSHLPSTFQPYHLLILCCNSLSLYKNHTLLSSVFLCGQIWPFSRDHSNLTFPGRLLGSAYPRLSHSPVLSSQHTLLSISGVTLPDLSPLLYHGFFQETNSV